MKVLNRNLKTHLYWAALSAIAGLLAGIAAALFLIFLDLATTFRDAHRSIIWLLPLAGLGIGYLYHRLGKDIAWGNHLIIDEIHDPKKVISPKMAPFIFLSTIVTHLFGGSAGREGTAVQMGASLADQLNRFFKISNEERKILLVAGAGAGFGAAIGAPFAGVIFGMEVIYIGRFKIFAVVECLIASFVAYYTTILLSAPHSHYPRFEIPPIDSKTMLSVVIAGVIFGLTARLFIWITHSLEFIEAKWIKYPPLKPFFAGILIVVLFYIEGSYRYAGLGISTIQDALLSPSHFREPILKVFFTALTVGSGFKGGEFIPLVFIGTTLGSALSIVLPVSFKLLAALGFAAVFGAAANTPIACTIMAMEIFGYEIGLYAFIACVLGAVCSTKPGIYRTQKDIRKI